MDNLFEQAILIGMTPHDFWEEDPDWFWVHRKIYIAKQKDEQQQMNLQSWLLGVYIQKAIASVFSKKYTYPNEPLDIGLEQNEVETKRKQEKQVAKTYANLKNWSSSFKGRFSKDTKKE